jgi:alpha-D-ribose 1-methylphosphonate 5-triphosphate synthase subunit PhnH
MDCAELRGWVAFHTGAPLASRAECQFALGRWGDLTPLDGYAIGTSEYPDRSATLIVEVETLAATGLTASVLTGPGIRDSARLCLPEKAAFQANHRLFPLGLDFLLTCGNRLAALPRSTQITAPEGH